MPDMPARGFGTFARIVLAQATVGVQGPTDIGLAPTARGGGDDVDEASGGHAFNSTDKASGTKEIRKYVCDLFENTIIFRIHSVRDV